MFTGEYRHSVDDKGRLAVPFKFRSQLADGGFVSRWMEGSLALHTSAGWESLANRVASLSTTDADARRFERFVFAGAFEIQPDRQGRILVPGYLREEASLSGEVVIVGSRDHAEIWAPARWAEYQRAMADPDAFAQAIANLGI